MASETRYSISLTSSKGGASVTFSLSKTVDMTGDDMAGNSQLIGTSTEAIALGDIGTPKYLAIKNMDDTNFVQIGLDTPLTQIFAKIPAGEGILVLMDPGATYYAKADTAAVRCFIAIVEA